MGACSLVLQCQAIPMVLTCPVLAACVNVYWWVCARCTISRNNVASVSVCAEQLVRRCHSLALWARCNQSTTVAMQCACTVAGPRLSLSLFAQAVAVRQSLVLCPLRSLASYCTVYRPIGERACTISLRTFYTHHQQRRASKFHVDSNI